MVDHIPNKWKNLKLEYTDEYKDRKNRQHGLKQQKLDQPEKIIVKNPLKDKPESILKNKDDVNREFHRCGRYDRCASKNSRCTIL